VKTAKGDNMSIRELEEYKHMNPFIACAVAEGFSGFEEASEEMTLAAWQYIADTQLWTQLQGFYGRIVHQLLAQRVIEPPLTQ